MKAYVARQPIFDCSRNVIGYELLFRSGLDNFFPNIDGCAATSKVLYTSFLGFDIDELSNGKMVYINFTKTLLLKQIPLLFPKDKIVVEILENIEVSTDLIDRIAELASAGYQLALDDFEYDPSLEPIISNTSIIKLDFWATPVDQIREYVEALKGRGLIFLAEKVEDYEQFELAKDIGCTLFQGYFFCKPEIMQVTDLHPNKLTHLQLLKSLYEPEHDVDEIENIITRDIGLSYKFLRYINSAFFSTSMEITSIKHAVTYLGIEETRRFMTLLVLAELSCDKPKELHISSVVRAKFCEELAECSSESLDKEQLFLIGLFSEIDAMLDLTMEEVMELLPLASSIKFALVNKAGGLYDYLSLSVHYEAGRWRQASALARKLGIVQSKLPLCYSNAVKLSNYVDNHSDY